LSPSGTFQPVKSLPLNSAENPFGGRFGLFRLVRVFVAGHATLVKTAANKITVTYEFGLDVSFFISFSFSCFVILYS
jgi:hypothetical protein